MRTFLCRFLLLCAFAIVPNISSAQTANAGETLKGKIGPYAITMHIDLYGGKEGQFIGTYYYNDRPRTKFRLKLVKMEVINLHGSMNVVLKEYAPNGKQTGTFNGQYEGRGSYYEGTFTNNQGKKYKFELEGMTN